MATREDLRAVLARNPWFRALPAGLADSVLDLGLVRRMDGRTVYAAGDPANGLFALISGEIRVFQATPEGRSALLLIASPGVWFGETAMIDGEPRSSDAMAIGPTRVLQITPAVFRRLTVHSSENYAAFARLVCGQYRRAMDYIVTTANLPLPVRLAQRLVGLVHAQDHHPTGGGLAVELHLSQEGLGAMVGVSRQSVNRALKALEAQAVLAVGYGAVTIHDVGRLEALARSRTLPAVLG